MSREKLFAGSRLPRRPSNNTSNDDNGINHNINDNKTAVIRIENNNNSANDDDENKGNIIDVVSRSGRTLLANRATTCIFV